MKTSSKDLTKALAIMLPVAAKRRSLPILNSLLLQADKGLLTITASDLDQTLTALVPCEGKLEPICAPAQQLSDLIGSANGSVTLKLARNRLEVQSGFKAELSTILAEEFPKTDISKPVKQGVNCKDLGEMTQSVAWCAAKTDLVRPALACVHVDPFRQKTRLRGSQRP